MRMLEYLALVLCLAAGAAEPPAQEVAGIGVVWGVEAQNVVVKLILPDSPAAAQNSIRVGDRITAVAQDQEPPVEIESANLLQAVRLVRGPEGTTVRMTIVPSGGDDSLARVVSFVRGEQAALASWGDGLLLTNGAKAPDIETVRLADKRSERISDYTGKIVVLEFRATWGGPCQPELADLQRLPAEYPGWKNDVVSDRGQR
jgi:hypothetical protein